MHKTESAIGHAWGVLGRKIKRTHEIQHAACRDKQCILAAAQGMRKGLGYVSYSKRAVDVYFGIKFLKPIPLFGSLPRSL